MADAKNAFLLMIHLEFNSIDQRDAWIALFKPLAAYCLENEPGTLGYDVAIADNNPLKVLVYERYPGAMDCAAGDQSHGSTGLLHNITTHTDMHPKQITLHTHKAQST